MDRIVDMASEAWNKKGSLYFDMDAMIVYDSEERANADNVWLRKDLDSKDYNSEEEYVEAVLEMIRE